MNFILNMNRFAMGFLKCMRMTKLLRSFSASKEMIIHTTATSFSEPIHNSSIVATRLHSVNSGLIQTKISAPCSTLQLGFSENNMVFQRCDHLGYKKIGSVFQQCLAFAKKMFIYSS